MSCATSRREEKAELIAAVEADVIENRLKADSVIADLFAQGHRVAETAAHLRRGAKSHGSREPARQEGVTWRRPQL